MKKLLLILMLGFVALQITAQKKRMSDNDNLKNKIVDLLNKNDYKGVYNLADISFKKEITEEQLVNFLTGTADLGKIIKTELLSTQKDGVSKYRLFYEKKSLQLDLKATKSLVFNVFGLTYYSLPIVNTRKIFLTDNAMKTKLDSSVQKAVTQYMSNENVSGLSVGVIENGKMFTYHFGEMKKGTKQLPTNETLYEIGSITKTFTGIILANNVKEGKINLHDDIRKYLDGDYPNLQYKNTPIQLVHLSNHTSRLPSQPLIVNTRKDPFDPKQVFTEKILTDILHNIKIDTIPGTKIEYSNFAVSLLGHILEKVNNLTYEQLLEKYIFTPTKMTQSKINFTKNDFKNYAQGYNVAGDTVNYWRNKLVEPAGGIRSTTKDMLLYMKAQLEAQKETATWLSHQLTTGDHKRGKGLNWGISTTKKGYLVWSHDGGTNGFSSLCLIYPELNSGIILLTNNGNHNDQSFYDIGKLIYLDWVK
ncbi:MAG: beta-lactamase family protein [Raineya sp.]|jgi:CubicO group peptidase (beta-lactamase class C family)|nr:beta-lactamase family protein [Raineya sp.]